MISLGIEMFILSAVTVKKAAAHALPEIIDQV